MRLFDGARALALSPDGSVVLRTVRPSGALQLVPVGPGEIRTLLEKSDIDWQAGEFSQHGRSVLAIGAPPGQRLRCYVQPLDGGQPIGVTPPGVEQCDISPDGGLIAASSTSAAVELTIYSIAGAPPRKVANALPGDIPVRWSSDGRGLYVRASQTVPAQVFLIDLVTGRRAPWRTLMPPDRAGVFYVDAPLIAADGRSYAYSYRRFLFDLYQVEGLR